MKCCRFLTAVVLTLALACVKVSAQSTAISYQGSLQNAGVPASGPYDFTFALYNAGTNGTQAGAVVTNLDVPVTNGFFTTMMNFGTNSFTGSNAWLQVSVRTNGSSGAFLPLSPRQLVTPAPFALFALNAGSGLTGPMGQPGTNGTNGLPGTTGQSAYTVYGTGGITNTTTTPILVPGLSYTNVFPSNAVTYISADGGMETMSGATSGFSDVWVQVLIDGNVTANGAYAEAMAVNNNGVVGATAHWSISFATTLTPVSHTIAVYSFLNSGSPAVVSSDFSLPRQGELTVMVLNQ
jgi:hypothetical protein